MISRMQYFENQLPKTPVGKFKYTYIALACVCLLLVLIISISVIQRQSYYALTAYIENHTEKIVDAICYTEVESITFNSDIHVSPNAYDYLNTRIRDTYDALDILRTTIYDTNLKVVYSNDKSLIGTSSKIPALFEVLSDGNTVSMHEPHRTVTDLNGEVRSNIDMVDVYVPVKNSNGKIIGIFLMSSNSTQLKSLYTTQLNTSITILVSLTLLMSLMSLVIILRETNKLKYAYSLLNTVAITDALTGVYNRTFYEAELERLSSSRRYPVAVVMIDLDGLKKTNDTYGHAAGDKMICKAADILKNAFRAEDMVARTGGDEFTVLLPETDAEGLNIASERLNKFRDEANCIDDGFRVQFSMGAEIAESREKLFGAVKNADMKMYQNKLERKNANG